MGLSFSSIYAQTEDPFRNSAGKQRIAAVKKNSAFLNGIVQIQREMNESITLSLENYKDKQSAQILLFLLGIVFLYGMIHALGPGHGKSIALSYFVTVKAGVLSGLFFGFLVALFHTGVSVFLVLLINLIFKNGFSGMSGNTDYFVKLASFGLISIIGLVLFLKRLIKISAGKRTEEQPVGSKNIILMTLAIGIVPCPAALTVLIFSMSQSVLSVGILLVIFMGMGMGITISAFSILTILAKSGTIHFINKNQDKLSTDRTRSAANLFRNLLELGGALFILFLGVAFLLGTILN
jgi:ABC-type nickel/cobalt efflux system permease component RcnA